ncbi:34-kDa subunit of RNA polymerase III (C) [Blyttiomyces sp. JEL0837]|nr:34-kDa subunit of RNA polymerase III (C) [Blyttiomyces sp. JEL0837]
MSGIGLTDKEEELFLVLKTFPQGANAQTLQKSCPYDQRDLVFLMNSLADKGFVDFITINKALAFRAKDIEEVNRTRDLNDNEKIVYNYIKAEKSKGIWIKDIKSRSGLHLQVLTDCIKTLEKTKLIKAVKSVKNPTKTLYMLYELSPSEEITGGAWYTDQELDVPFIENLSEMVLKFIAQKSFPKSADKSAVFGADYQGYATVRDVSNFIKKTGIITVELALMDVQMLVDRLWYDGKVQRIVRFGKAMGSGGFAGRGRAPSVGSGDEWEGDEMVIDDDEVDTWMYKANKFSADRGSCLTDIPCGKCPVASFCKEGGPVNPENCVYLDKWLQF